MSQNNISNPIAEPDNTTKQVVADTAKPTSRIKNIADNGFRYVRIGQDRARTLLNSHPKLLVILVASIFLLIVNTLNTSNPITKGDNVSYDDNWIMGLPAELQQGHISGRDFWINQGPLWQLISLIGVGLSRSGSAFDAFSIIKLSLSVFGILVIGITLGLLKEINWKFTVFLYTVFACMYIPLPIVGGRPILTVLCAVLLVRTLTSPTLRRQVIWGVILGITAFLAQLITVEIGVYVFAASAAVLVLYSLLSLEPVKKLIKRTDLLPVKNSLSILGAISVSYIACNLLIDLFFLITSSNYTHLLDYQFYMLEIMRGYNNTMGSQGPWPLSALTTFAFILIILYGILVTIYSLFKLSPNSSYLFVSLTASSLIQLKSALVRSDSGHLMLAFTPMVFAFLIMGKDLFGSSTEQTPQKRASKPGVIWISLAAVLIIIWPASGLGTAKTLWDWADGAVSLTAKINAIRNIQVPQKDIVPEGLRAVVDPNKVILNFPNANYLDIGLNQKFIAPIHLATGAHTLALQEKYVEMMDKQKSNLEIIYGLDALVAPPFELVQHVTRVPLIFEYMYRNFELKSQEVYGKGYIVLKPRPQPIEVKTTELPFTTKTIATGETLLQLNKTGQCSLLRFNAKVNYPITSLLGRPGKIQLRFWAGGKIAREYNFVPIEVGKEFTAYMSLANWNDFPDFFSNTHHPAGITWDSIQISLPSSGFPDIQPSSANITKLECVNL